MPLYTSLLQMADNILRAFQEKKIHRGDFSYFIQSFGYVKGSPETELLVNAIDKLYNDKYVKEVPEGSNYYFVTGEGLLYIEHGGYEKSIERENQKEVIKEAFEELSKKATENTIETGNSVQTLNRILKPTTIMQVVIAFLLLLVTGGTAYIAYLSYNFQKVNNDLEKRLKSLETSLPKIESQIQKPLPLKGRDTVYMIAIKEKK